MLLVGSTMPPTRMVWPAGQDAALLQGLNSRGQRGAIEAELDAEAPASGESHGERGLQLRSVECNESLTQTAFCRLSGRCLQ